MERKKRKSEMENDICNYIPEQISIVMVDGEQIDTNNVEFLNIEEDVHGRDMMTFNYQGKEHKSIVLTKYI
jgi:hypothetical protein